MSSAAVSIPVLHLLFERLQAGDTSGFDPLSRATRAAEPASELTVLPADDARMISRISTGDTDALVALYASHSTPMWRLATRLTGSPDIAADVVHDVFLNIWRTRVTWQPRVALHIYFLRAARNESLRILAHASVVRHHAPTVRDIAAVLQGEPDVSADLSAREVDSAVANAVACLPERQRTAFLLRWDDGLSNAAVGRILQISDVAAGKLIAKAQRTLRDALQKYR